MFSPHNFENTQCEGKTPRDFKRVAPPQILLHHLLEDYMVQSLNKYSDCCEILSSFTKYFLRYMFLKNAPLSHLQPIVLHTETHV